jgi:hypothetical protein
VSNPQSVLWIIEQLKNAISSQSYPTLQFNMLGLTGSESYVLLVVSPDQTRPIVAVTEGGMPRSPFC